MDPWLDWAPWRELSKKYRDYWRLQEAQGLCEDDGWWVDKEDFDFEPFDPYPNGGGWK
jgi:hypothetical protein